MLLFKYETLKNSYLIFDPERAGYAGAVEAPDFLSWVVRMCDVHSGIGSDGLLFGPFRASSLGFEFRVVNSDGGFSEFSGNGARIFGQYLLDAGYVPADQPFSFFANAPSGNRIKVDARRDAADPVVLVTDLNVEPKSGPQAVAANPAAISSGGEEVCVPALEAIASQMGFPEGAWSDSSPLSIGNPHCVTFVDSPDLLPSFDRLVQFEDSLSAVADGKGHAAARVFAHGCNLQWAYAATRKSILLRIVERREGPTMASGSSASAAAIAAWTRGFVDEDIEVVMPGGTVKVRLNVSAGNIASVTLKARATRIAEIKAGS